MGLFDKIKDNARDLSMKAIEATREEIIEEDEIEQVVEAPAPVVTAVEETVEFEETPVEEKKEEPKPEVPKEEKEDEKSKTAVTVRHSKVTEVSKTDYENAKKSKKADEAKQAAKERLAKEFTPSYKSNTSAKTEPAAPAAKKPSASRPVTPIGIIDITPGKFTDPTKDALYARERAALNVIASQRKLEGTVPLYVTTHMNFRTRVFIDRIEYSGSFGKTKVPISHVAWVKLRSTGTGIIIETVEGKRLVMVVKPADRLAFADAVLKVQSMQPKRGKFKDTKTVRIDELEKFGEGVDEIEKLAKLYDKGILSREEFEAKKKQILGI